MKHLHHSIQSRITLLIYIFLVLSILLIGCGPSTAELEAVDYTPLEGDDWLVSTPEEQDLDPLLVARMYAEAAELETIYGLLVIKNGHLVAEEYFQDASVERKENVQSVTKSYISALVGIALERGCLSSLDQKMLDFFPELADQITDPRKEQITLRQLLQMRAGYPWEESDPALWEGLWSRDYLPLIVAFPLISDPGIEMHYSNLTPDWLSMIVTRACDTDLKSFAQDHLLSLLEVEVGDWMQDRDGYYVGHGEMRFTAREMAKFGQLVLNEGEFGGRQILSKNWMRDSLQIYSEDAWEYHVGRNFNDVGYGYMWWSVRAGEYRYHLAWGHGGQQIAVLQDLDMVLVVTADPLYGQTGDGPWRHERANLNLVADFIASLPSE
jgi:CubicO group peptidase (beta-lactamase class C family)